MALLLTLGSGCSNGSNPGAPDSGAGSCAQFNDDADLTMPMVSLKNDVLPIFQNSCSLSASCHGAMNGGPGGLFLGQKGMTVDTVALLKTLTGPSHEEPSQAYVVPNDPTKSYLMHKMDGDQCLFDPKCTIDMTFNTPNCPEAGVAMPQSSGLLSVSQRDTVRRWIAQGAQNN